MPAWAIDKDIWARAFGLFVKNHGRKPSSDDFKVVVGIYKKLGGRISKSKSESVTEDYETQALKDAYAEYTINELYKEYVE